MLEELSMCVTIILVTFAGCPSGTYGTSVAMQRTVIKKELLEQHPKGAQEFSQATEAKLVKAAADLFVRRFHASLDFRTVFEEMRVSDVSQRLKKANFFQGLNINAELIDRLDDRRLREIYESFMNLYYLRIIYDFGKTSGEDPKSSKSRYVPPEIIDAIKSSPFKNLLSDPVTSDTPVISADAQLTHFIDDLNRVATLYRRHLSRRVFNSANYKANIRQLNDDRKVGFQIKHGLAELGVAEDTKVYVFEKDIFIMLFLEERRQLKILTFSPD